MGGGGALSRATASSEVQGEGGQKSEGHGYGQTFTVSDISEATSYIFDLKKLHKERRRGRKEKQYYIFSTGLCLIKTTLNKGTGTFSWGLCIGDSHPAPHGKVTSLAEKGLVYEVLLSPKGYKSRGVAGEPH